MTSSDGRTRMRLTVAAVCAGALVLTACDGGGEGGDGAGSTDGSGRGGFLGLGGDDPDPVSAALTTPDQEAVVVAGESAEALAAGTSGALFASSPVVVLAHEDEQLRAASAGAALGVPVLVDGPDAGGEIERLGAEVALALGAVDDPGIDVVVPQDDAQLADLLGIDADAVTVSAEDAAARISELDPKSPQLLVPADSPGTDDGSTDDTGTTAGPEDGSTTADPAPLEPDRDELPATEHPEPLVGVALMSTGASQDLAALGTARAAGVTSLVSAQPDPRATSEGVQALAELDPTTVIGLGTGFGAEETLAWKARTARTGVELPGGGQLALPGKTYIALYGTPVTSALGVLGEQPIEETITRAQEHAGWYEPLTDETVIPTLEIIATVASAGAGADGNYSNELPISDLEPLVDLAEEQGLYVVIDLQPGRLDFVSQAKKYEELLVRPHVGLALDPEWRLGPDEVHMLQIGTVGVDEVNEVVTWLADLTREHDLPQKVLVLHMFQLRMIPEVDRVDQSREELAVLIHADGQGSQPAKQDTWRALHDYAPSVQFWGWKNFYDEDTPMLSPEETMTQVDPVPDFVSYQ